MRRAALIGLLLGATNVADGQTAAAASIACDKEPAMHLLDFWLGDWRVADPSGAPVGENKIERVLDGCAITETWHEADGSGEVRGVFYYRPDEHSWRLVLITTDALALGGVRERHLVAKLDGGGVRFLGELRSGDRVQLNRMTLTPREDSVREVVDVSADGGTTWRTTFDGIYTRKTR